MRRHPQAAVHTVTKETRKLMSIQVMSTAASRNGRTDTCRSVGFQKRNFQIIQFLQKSLFWRSLYQVINYHMNHVYWASIASCTFYVTESSLWETLQQWHWPRLCLHGKEISCKPGYIFRLEIITVKAITLQIAASVSIISPERNVNSLVYGLWSSANSNRNVLYRMPDS